MFLKIYIGGHASIEPYFLVSGGLLSEYYFRESTGKVYRFGFDRTA